MTFASGFAQAYIAADQKRQDREQELEDTQFKYKMETLMDNKKLRVAKQLQETQNAKKAQDLAAMYGDTSTAPYWNTQLNNGVDYDNLYKGISSGDYSANDKYVKPTQTVKVPAAVTMNYDDTGTDGPQYDAVNKRIDAIDPTLRKQTVTPTVNDDGSANMLVYNPKSQKNLPDLGTAMNNLKVAQANKDPKAIRDAQQQVQSIQQSKVWEAQANAHAQGKSGQQMGVVLDDQGRITPGGLISAEVRDDPDNPGQYKTYNVTNDPNGVPVSGNFRIIDPPTMQRMNTITDQFGKDSQDTKAASSNYVAALNSANIMQKIAKQNPDATTKYVAGGVEILNNLKGEAGAAWKQLQAVEQQMVEDKGDPDSLEKDVAAHTQALEKFMNSTLTSPANEKLAIDAALYRSARMSLVTNLAASNGLSASKTSDKDWEHMLQQIGGDDARWNVIEPVLQQALGDGLVNIDAKRTAINNAAAPKQFKQQTGIDLNLSVPRIQDLIAQSEMDPQRQAELIAYLKQIKQPLDYGQALAGQQGAQQTGQYKDPNVNTEAAKPVVIQNKEEFDKLPSGTLFTAPDGTTRRKP